MIKYSIFGISIAESWFFPEEDLPATDLYYVQQAIVPPSGFSFASPFTTLVIDLTKSEAQLLAEMHKKTRYKIGRANTQDNINYVVDSECNLDRFLAFFLLCERVKKVTSINMERLEQYKMKNMLHISYVEKNGEPLSMHCFLVFAEITRPIFACILRSLDSTDVEYSNLLGRANCLHFWEDMLHFKNAGKTQFDCGGWYQGTNIKLAKIAKFKQGFGGEVCHQFTCIKVNTIKGRLYMLLKLLYLSCRRMRL